MPDRFSEAHERHSTDDDTPGERAVAETHEASRLRKRVMDHLRAQGFRPTSAGLIAPVLASKEDVRALHAEATRARVAELRRPLARYESEFVNRMQAGQDLIPATIRPRLVLVDDRRSRDAALWRWCAAHWSIPVSSGYGRRLRFLAVDSANGDAPIGIIGLGDPVFSLSARDAAIGWNMAQRTARLACVMDAFALGSVPPYSSLLGGKLVAMLAGSVEVQEAFRLKYGNKKTLIADRDPNAHLSMITTTSALGRSSVYNRVRRADGSLVLESVGFTKGSGDFHLSGELYEELTKFLKEYLPRSATHRHSRWGAPGFRNRREVVQKSLEALGLNSRALRVHGVAREIFLSRLAHNTDDFLRGETDVLDGRQDSVIALSQWWIERWALPRSSRTSDWRKFDPESWRLF